ncbi:hypothetical protein JOQ06_025739 [Pogonophryne albipinna]|uniref:Uncharacterized protein n=1 Tax=Pogonophryne albipinna TaxID=1090488 RepID=A0AAD6AWB9_9TELE|nr:hypothetical protein JOQ06_025739 [Pogonophryne albipinna]
MPGGRPTSLLDPIPASHSPLAGSEAAVPGEKRGPGKAQSLGGPAYKDSHKPPLFETPGFVGKGRGHLLGCLSRVVWWGEGTERVAERPKGRRRERSREHGSDSAVSLGANESHLGGRDPGASQQALRLLEQLQHTGMS